MIYATATDHINKHPYKLLVPPHVLAIHREALIGDLFAPLYESYDHKQPQRAMMPIARMVEFVISKTVFTIVDDYEVLEILHQIDAYVEEVLPLMRGDKAVASYVEKILRLRVRIYQLFRRVMSLHPDWKKVYSHGQNIFGVITQLYQLLGLSVDAPQNLFEELSICPAVRSHPEFFTTGAIPNNKPTGTRVAYDV
jgi:hypothetical protein